MTVPIAQYLQRITDKQESLIANSQAFAFANVSHDTYPFWANQVGLLPSDTPLNNAQRKWRVQITISLFVGKATAGISGEIETEAQGYLYTVASGFDDLAPAFTTPNYTTGQTGYAPGSLRVSGANIVLIGGSENSSPDIAVQTTITFTHNETRAR